MTDSKKQVVLMKGIGVSSGIVIGRAYILERGMLEPTHFIAPHLMILKDNMLINDTIKAISEQRVNAEWALKTVLKDIMEYFEKMDDPYLRERALDIEHM